MKNEINYKTGGVKYTKKLGENTIKGINSENSLGMKKRLEKTLHPVGGSCMRPRIPDS